MKNGRKVSILSKAKVTVLDSSKTGIKAIYADEIYETQMLKERPKNKSIPKAKSETKNRIAHSPAPDHPWRISTKD